MLSNMDYKILFKIMLKRLARGASKWILPAQSSMVKAHALVITDALPVLWKIFEASAEAVERMTLFPCSKQGC